MASPDIGSRCSAGGQKTSPGESIWKYPWLYIRLFSSKLKENPPDYNIRFCNLTRHPVARAQSFYKRFSHTQQWRPEPTEIDAARKSNARNLRDEVLSRLRVDIYNDDKWLFPDTIIRMRIQYAEAMLEDLPQVKSEDITSDREQFRRLFADLTDGRVELTAEMLSDQNFSRRLNRTLDKPASLPIRLTPMTATCRVPPLSRVKLGIGWSRGVARDAEQ